MRFAVLGAGAIGAYVGASLARGGAEVILIARGPNLAAMRRDGVRVVSREAISRPNRRRRTTRRRSQRPTSCSRPEGLFAARAAAAHRSVARAGRASSCRPRTASPGGSSSVSRSPCGGSRAVDPGGGSPAPSLRNASSAASRIRRRSWSPRASFATSKARASRSASPTVAVRTLPGGRRGLRGGRAECPVEERIREQLWLKLIGNVAFNPVTALTGATLGELGNRRRWSRAARADGGVALSPTRSASAPGHGRPTARSGLRGRRPQDVDAAGPRGRQPLELGCMTGAVVEIAGRLGVPVPHVETVHACVGTLDRLRQTAGQQA